MSIKKAQKRDHRGGRRENAGRKATWNNLDTITIRVPKLIATQIIDKILLIKRSRIETVNDQLKNISQVQHTRNRSVCNFMVNVIAGLIAYTYQNKKPSLNLTTEDLDSLQEAHFLKDETLSLAII